jgi:16S rRNA (guanine527-N7)-methyltransferase
MVAPGAAGVPTDLEASVVGVVEEARAIGMLGPGPIEVHVRHARGFAAAWRKVSSDRGRSQDPPIVIDLGSGGGIPALVLALEWPSAKIYLVEAGQRRAAFLRRALDRCGLESRIAVLEERAEVVGRNEDLRGLASCVTARGFGRPAVTAECAAPLLRPGGWLIVSAPPEGGTTAWSATALAELGLAPAIEVRQAYGYLALQQVEPCPERFPRRSGVPQKRPLFG